MEPHLKRELALMLCAAIVAAAVSAAGQEAEPMAARRNAKPDNGNGNQQAKDERLSMADIVRLRRQRLPQDQIVEQATEHGVSFKTTPAVESQLRRMHFSAEQIASIKSAYQEPAPDAPANLVPGSRLRIGDAQRDAILEEIKKINAASHADLHPLKGQHVTLWSAKSLQAAFMPDIEKLEKYFRTRCREPLRSGLDNRAAHIVLFSRRYEFENWVNSMFALDRRPFQGPRRSGRQ